MSMCLSKCYLQGPYVCCCYRDRTRGSSLLQGPTNKPVATPWTLSTLCRGTAGSDMSTPRHGWQHCTASSQCLAKTAALAEQWGLQRAMLSKLYQTAYIALAKTLRGIMMTHEKQNQHNFQKLSGKSSAASSYANSTEHTVIHGDLPVHQEQPLSLSRLF